MLDRDIRRVLRAELKLKHAAEPSTVIVDELGISDVRADLVTISDDHMCGFEIKSQKDTLKRLPKQVEVYSDVFNYCTLVADTKHIEKADAIIPSWWGLVRSDYDAETGKTALVHLRESGENPKLEAITICQLLWKEETLEELKLRKIDRGVRSKARYHAWLKMSRELPVEEITQIVRNRLRTRPNWR